MEYDVQITHGSLLEALNTVPGSTRTPKPQDYRLETPNPKPQTPNPKPQSPKPKL
jgi:hypothetical protein